MRRRKDNASRTSRIRTRRTGIFGQVLSQIGSRTASEADPTFGELCEPLEPRVMLSAVTNVGDLSVTMRDGVLTVMGTNQNDWIELDQGAAAGEVVVKNIGDGEASAFTGVKAVVVSGKGGNDRLAVAPGLIGLNGGPIDVVAKGGGGDDHLTGGDGNDTLKGGRGNDRLEGEGGDDRLIGGAGDDAMTGGAGLDRLLGGRGNDQLEGGDDNDRLSAGGGSNVLSGGTGFDRLRGGRGGNEFYADAGDLFFTRPNDQFREVSSSQDRPILSTDEGVRTWLVDAAVARYSSWFGTSQKSIEVQYISRFGMPEVVNFDGADGGGVGLDANPDYSDTNTQEDGVDEADIIKTDGNYIYLLSGNELLIVDSFPIDELSIISRTTIEGSASEMYLVGDQLVVLSHEYTYDERPGFPSWPPVTDTIRPAVRLAADSLFAPRNFEVNAVLTVFDITDRANPELQQRTVFDGSITTSRGIDDKIHVVLNNNLFLPSPIILDGTDQFETREQYIERVGAMSLEQLAPAFEVFDAAGELVASGDLVGEATFPESDIADGSQQLISVVTLDLSELGEEVDAVSALGSWGQVYASTDSLFIAASEYRGPWTGDEIGWVTHIQKFDLTGDDVTLTATGEVPGNVLDQFSMDEEGGILRVAVTETAAGSTTNSVYLFTQAGDELEEISSVEGLGLGERIFSVRFVGDVGYVVTFRQVDPVYTLDLSDSLNPFVAGELKVPGFSTYLHPVGDTHLIGLGRDADPESGRALGLKLSFFDVSDLANPTEQDSWIIGDADDYIFSDAQYDHRAFSYFPESGILALPVSEGSWWWEGDTGVEVFRVTPEGGIEELGDIEHESPVLRSLRIDDLLYTYSREQIKVTSLTDPQNVVATLRIVQEDGNDDAGNA